MEETSVDRFYEDARSLFVRAYDALYDDEPPSIAGDVNFYERLADESAGAVLELGCGTGRITLRLAARGFAITGIDLSDGMLAVARSKSETLSIPARERLTLINQDMSELKFDGRFGLIFVPFRSFQHILTNDGQRKTLEAIGRHLRSDGRLALHVFDPRLDLLVDEDVSSPGLSGTDPTTRHRYVGEVLRTRFDHLAQIRRDLWRYAEFGATGELIGEQTREMALRWTYRWELRHLLELSGFAVEAEYSDFKESPPVYGKELILVARIAE